MPTIGHIGEFNPEIENFKSYETRIRQYFVANDIAAAKQVPAFISTIGLNPLEMQVTSAVNLIHATQWKPSPVE